MQNLVEQLLLQQNECTLCWLRRDGSPAATIVSFFSADGSLWMTATAGAARVRALQRDSRCTVVISGKGTPVGISRCVSLQGHCVIHEDASVRDWFFPRFARAVLPDSKQGAPMMASMMNTPDNVVLQFTPDRVLPFDSHDMMVQANRY